MICNIATYVIGDINGTFKGLTGVFNYDNISLEPGMVLWIFVSATVLAMEILNMKFILRKTVFNKNKSIWKSQAVEIIFPFTLHQKKDIVI